MAGTKELFNQPLTTVDKAQHRIALSYPSKEGADNILATSFMATFLKYGKDESVTAGNNTITLASAFEDANYVIFIRTTGSGYSIVSQDAGSFVVNFLEADTIDYLCLKI